MKLARIAGPRIQPSAWAEWEGGRPFYVTSFCSGEGGGGGGGKNHLLVEKLYCLAGGPVQGFSSSTNLSHSARKRFGRKGHIAQKIR